MVNHPRGADATFGNAFRTARQRTHSQEQVAEEMQKRGFDFHQATVYKIETGKRKVTIGEALALAEIVRVPIEVLSEDPESVPAKTFATTKAAQRVYELMSELDRVAREGRLSQHLLHDMAQETDKASGDTGERSLVEHFRPIYLYRIFRDVDDALNDVMSNPTTHDLLVELGFVKEDAEWRGEVEGGER